MPLWLDLLRTPMAAPETSVLRRMRLTWQGLCLSLGVSVGLLPGLRQLFGEIAPAGIAVLLLTTLAYSWLYIGQKRRADDAYLASLGDQP